MTKKTNETNAKTNTPQKASRKSKKAHAAAMSQPTLRQRLRPLLSHPWVAVVPIVALLWLGWQQYLTVSRPVNVSENNLLESGSFEKLDANGLPHNWQLLVKGEAGVTTGSSKGYVKGSGMGIYVRNYKSGDVTLHTPKVTVQPGKKYLFKGYYLTTAPFDLLVRSYYKDGSSRLETIREYPANTDPWSTVSYAFKAADNLQSVELVYRLTADGDLQLDDTYLEEKEDGLYIPTARSAGENLIPNAQLTTEAQGLPQDWTNYTDGLNKPTFTYAKEGTNRTLQTTITDYKDGEAKWQYLPLAVKPGQAFSFAVDYTSTTKAEVTAEYELEDGTRKFDTPLTLKPASEWTHATTTLEVPSNAKTMFVAVILHGNGTLSTDNYELRDITRLSHDGNRRFDRPLVSLTFDDGWQSSYDPAATMMEKFGYKGTYYLNSGTVDTGIFMNQKQIQDLATRGHQLAAHGDDHLDMTSISDKKLHHELQSTYDYLHKSFGLATQDFATPYGKSDAEVQWYARQFYRSHRGTSTGLNTKQNFDPYNLEVLFVTKDTPLSTIDTALKEAKEYNGWLILVYHRVEDKLISSTTITPKTFQKQLELITKENLPVVTVEQALAEIAHQQ